MRRSHNGQGLSGKEDGDMIEEFILFWVCVLVLFCISTLGFLLVRRWWHNRRIKAQVREITMALREGAKECYLGEGSRKVEGKFRLRVNNTDLGEIKGLEISFKADTLDDIAVGSYIAGEVLRELGGKPYETVVILG